MSISHLTSAMQLLSCLMSHTNAAQQEPQRQTPSPALSPCSAQHKAPMRQLSSMLLTKLKQLLLFVLEHHNRWCGSLDSSLICNNLLSGLDESDIVNGVSSSLESLPLRTLQEEHRGKSAHWKCKFSGDTEAGEPFRNKAYSLNCGKYGALRSTRCTSHHFV